MKTTLNFGGELSAFLTATIEATAKRTVEVMLDRNLSAQNGWVTAEQAIATLGITRYRLRELCRDTDYRDGRLYNIKALKDTLKDTLKEETRI